MNDDRHISMRVRSDFTDHIEEKKKILLFKKIYILTLNSGKLLFNY